MKMTWLAGQMRFLLKDLSKRASNNLIPHGIWLLFEEEEECLPKKLWRTMIEGGGEERKWRVDEEE